MVDVQNIGVKIFVLLLFGFVLGYSLVAFSLGNIDAESITGNAIVSTTCRPVGATTCIGSSLAVCTKSQLISKNSPLNTWQLSVVCPYGCANGKCKIPTTPICPGKTYPFHVYCGPVSKDVTECEGKKFVANSTFYQITDIDLTELDVDIKDITRGRTFVDVDFTLGVLTSLELGANGKVKVLISNSELIVVP